MIKVFKSKIFLGVTCIILAAVIAFVLLPRFYASKNNTTHAIKVTLDIPAGTVITHDMLTQAEVGAFGLPDNVARSTENIIGMVASENMYTGEFMTTARLLTEAEYTALMAEQTKGLEKGYCLVTVEFPTASAGVASILRGGHIVDVHECIENEDKSISVVKTLESMYVYDVLNQELESLTQLDERLAEAIVAEDTDYDFQPAYVVFRCTIMQAQTLIRLERMEAMHLTLQRTGE